MWEWMRIGYFAEDLASSSFTETPTNSWALTLSLAQISLPAVKTPHLFVLGVLRWPTLAGKHTTGAVPAGQGCPRRVAELHGWGAQGQAATQHGCSMGGVPL